MFKKNMGSADRAIRVLIGVIAISAGICLKSWWGALGVIPLLTAAIGSCPLYLPCGLSTCRTKTKNKAV
jgi:hypothetical protein